MWDPTFVFVVVRLHAVSALCSWNPSRRSFVARKATFTCSSLFRFFSKCWASRIVVSQETLGVNGSRLVLLRKRIVSLVEGGSETREVVSEPRYHVLPRRGTMCCPGEVPCAAQARYHVLKRGTVSPGQLSCILVPRPGCWNARVWRLLTIAGAQGCVFDPASGTHQVPASGSRVRQLHQASISGTRVRLQR
jgi:hypothetical protein